jgi:formate--tetrahydrofolate ligase
VRHIENVRSFGVPVVVAVNQFITDTAEEVAVVEEIAKAAGTQAIQCSHWSNGSKGTEELAHKVVELVEGGTADFKPLYEDSLPLFDKIDTIAKKIYRATGAIADSSVRNKLKGWEADGYGHLPVCMAKTQYSFSTDPALRGAPSGHEVPVRDVILSAGAEFVVAVCGDIMRMPGLPRTPSADAIHLDDKGQIQGLF